MIPCVAAASPPTARSEFRASVGSFETFWSWFPAEITSSQEAVKPRGRLAGRGGCGHGNVARHEDESAGDHGSHSRSILAAWSRPALGVPLAAVGARGEMEVGDRPGLIAFRAVQMAFSPTNGFV